MQTWHYICWGMLPLSVYGSVSTHTHSLQSSLYLCMVIQRVVWLVYRLARDHETDLICYKSKLMLPRHIERWPFPHSMGSSWPANCWFYPPYNEHSDIRLLAALHLPYHVTPADMVSRHNLVWNTRSKVILIIFIHIYCSLLWYHRYNSLIFLFIRIRRWFSEYWRLLFLCMFIINLI